MAIVKKKWGDGHRYWIDGVYARGVTTIIGRAIPKDALNGWYARMVAEHVADNLAEVASMGWKGRDRLVNELKSVPNQVRDAAGERGKRIHAIAEKLMRGEKVEVPADLRGHVRSCLQFMDDYEPEPIRSETVVASRALLCCGTFDDVSRTKSDGVSIWDYKSGNGVYPEAAVQLGGYDAMEVYCVDQPDGSLAEFPMADLGIENGRVVHLREDGYDVWPVDNLAAAADVFRAAVEMSRARDRMDDLLGVPLLAPANRLGGAA